MNSPTQSDPQGKKEALGILSISLLTMTPGIVSPTLPAISKAYPAVSHTTIDLISTLPSFTMALFVFLGLWIIKAIGTKKTVELGLVLVTISTLCSLLAPNIWLLLASRALLGIGIGMYNPLAMSLITFTYKGPEQERLLGLENSFQGLGAMGGSILVAGLMFIHWRAAFLIYAVAIPILWFYHRYVPDIAIENKGTSQQQVAPKATNWAKIAACGLIVFILMVFYMIATVKIPTYLVDSAIGSANTGSLLVGLMSLATIIAGVVYGRLYTWLQRQVLLLAGLLMLVGYLCYGFVANLVLATLGAFAVGFSFGIFIPMLFGESAQAADVAKANLVSTMMMICTNLANFTSPFFANLLQGSSPQLKGIFAHSTWVILVLLGLILWYNFKQKSTKVAAS
ncbi:transporter, major facilitator family protein [Agrilactobacillus composti DSM 18527 = JCM 14202]|uniref:Transporter, major facilitator family protein n=1 Tax=Agrilactobacillus composti DSM 18527 = JCM 14202 TaxID=1423734 RepID=A0A0R1XXU3_9LACO|nr:MFS transporter [Agrilactobacillus composti]KRM32795.1 transporter, major facilitator family protein [Agrilactobacillus composti DSM 18527 = JCM 14202]